jgi:hypothetical protein
MENEHRPRALADDEVAGLGPGVDVLWPFVDGNAVLDSISRRPRSARTTAFVAARQIAPEVLALVGDAIDEGVDGLEPQGPQAALVAGLEPSGDLFGAHPSASRSRTKVLSVGSFSSMASRRLRS